MISVSRTTSSLSYARNVTNAAPARHHSMHLLATIALSHLCHVLSRLNGFFSPAFTDIVDDESDRASGLLDSHLSRLVKTRMTATGEVRRGRKLCGHLDQV